jgi:hypothetical protein
LRKIAQELLIKNLTYKNECVCVCSNVMPGQVVEEKEKFRWSSFFLLYDFETSPK